jgi:hypothetical protein
MRGAPHEQHMTAPLGTANLLRAGMVGTVCLGAAFDVRRRHHTDARPTAARVALALWSLVAIAFTVFLWTDHLHFPFLLDLMEGTILQHVARAAHGLPVYPLPTPDFVPLAYNPLYYYLSAPVTWVMGLDLPALRLVAIAGMAGSGAVIYLAVRDWTTSHWWGLIGLGLFAAAYRVMDAYLDTAHSDSWLLCAALLGTYVIDRASTRAGRMTGVIILVLGFWFKQHGALFALGGVAFLTGRDGWKASLPYWLVAAALGPLAYVAASPWPFGPAFHFFTWDVPHKWSAINAGAVSRVVRFAARSYLPLVAACAIALFKALRGREPVRIWHVQCLFGAGTALLGALDSGSSDNVFIPFGAFVIVLGTVELANAVQAGAGAWTQAAQSVVVAIAFVPLIYAPQSVILSPHAAAAYADFVGVVHGLDGPLYAPDIGELAGPPLFHPGAHWVALDDMGRGTGHTDADRAYAYGLMAPAEHPAGAAYLMTNLPLSAEQPPLSLLARMYVLQTDFGSRFAALAGLPKRYNHRFPRFLYRFGSPAPSAAAQSGL